MGSQLKEFMESVDCNSPLNMGLDTTNQNLGINVHKNLKRVKLNPFIHI